MATDPETVPGLLPVLRLAMTDGLVVDAAVRAWMHAVGCSPDDCRCHELDDSYAGDEAMTRALEAAAKAVEPYLAKPAVPGRDVIHDPATDWCACEPNGPKRCSYRMLADAVIDQCARCAALGQRGGQAVQR
jgi:hypothetical protein